jgi:predicted anti-sigma-YlaC factor YlaD
MTGCAEIRERLAALLDEPADAVLRPEVRAHLEACDDCRELADSLTLIAEAVAPLEGLEPPSGLAREIASSPCRRWLGLLFHAVDREIGEANLTRLLSHLESCEGCRRTWNDLALIHQVSEALEPPDHLLGRCISVRWRPRRPRVLSRRTVAAAAYALAVITTLLFANPVSQAWRQDTLASAEQLTTTVVDEVAERGRGTVEGLLLRTWSWTNRQAAVARDFLTATVARPTPAPAPPGDPDTAKEDHHG